MSPVRQVNTARTHEDALAALAWLTQLGESDVSGVMLVAGKRKADPAYLQLRVAGRAMPALSEVIHGAAQGFADSELIPYEPATTPVDGQLMWIDASAVPFLTAIAGQSTDMASMPLFEGSEEKLGDVRLAALSADANGTSAVFVQSLRASQIVAQSRKIGVIFHRGTIDVPDGDILLFNKDVLVAVVDGVAFFRDRRSFQLLFGVLEELQERAAETFDLATTGLRIEGIDEMRSVATSYPAMLDKMASIQRKLDAYPQYRAAFTMPNIVKFAEEHPECGVEVAGSGDSAQLIFRSDPQHRFKIFKLLDDDYLRSELTALEYEANSKSAPLGATT